MRALLTASILILGQSLVGPSASASLFVTDLVDGSGTLPIPGNQAWPGQLGDDFTTTSPISITRIGVFDDDGDGTVGDLVWQLFKVSDGSLIHEETVSPAMGSGGMTIESNYVFVDLAMAIVLPAGMTYSAVAYGFDDTDKNFNTNMNLADLDVVFNTNGLTAHGGRYSNAGGMTLPTIGAANVASAQAYNFGAATFEYSVVPEAASLAVWAGLGLAGTSLLISRRRRKESQLVS